MITREELRPVDEIVTEYWNVVEKARWEFARGYPDHYQYTDDLYSAGYMALFRAVENWIEKVLTGEADPEEVLTSYLLRSVKNGMADELRRQTKHRSKSVAQWSFYSLDAGASGFNREQLSWYFMPRDFAVAEPGYVELEDIEELLQKIDSTVDLDPQLPQILWRLVFEDTIVVDVAEAFGLSPAQVHKRLDWVERQWGGPFPEEYRRRTFVSGKPRRALDPGRSCRAA